MSKKKYNQTIVNNIESINMEIDYDKLAEAIIKANEKAKENKKTDKFRTRAISMINGSMYAVVYGGAVVLIWIIWSVFYVQQVYSAVTCAVYTIFALFIGIYAFLCQQESNSDNVETALAHFNANISLSALIIALVALIKG